MDNTGKENNFLVGWQRGINQYEAQMAEHYEKQTLNIRQ